MSYGGAAVWGLSGLFALEGFAEDGRRAGQGDQAQGRPQTKMGFVRRTRGGGRVVEDDSVHHWLISIVIIIIRVNREVSADGRATGT